VERLKMEAARSSEVHNKKSLKREIISEFVSKESNLREMGLSINALLTSLMRQTGIESNFISYRVKTKDSLDKKITSKNKYKKLSEITDLVGFRIVAFYATDINAIAEMIDQEFVIDEGNSIDKRKAIEPDRFGYMSLHYIVSLKKTRADLPEYINCKDFKFEIQIRTILQHAWAEIEHKLGYKSKSSMPGEIKRSLSILSGTLELIDNEFISIRDRLDNYDTHVSELISSGKENDIGLNERSFKVFMNESQIFKDDYLDFVKKTKATDRCEFNISESYKADDVDPSTIIEDFKKIGIKTLGDVTHAMSILKSNKNHEILIELLIEDHENGNDTEYDKNMHFVFSLLIYVVMRNGSIKPLSDTEDEYKVAEESIIKAINNQKL